MQPGSHDRPGIQSHTPCSWKIHRLEKYEPLTLPKLLPRMPSTDNPRNDQRPGTCTQVVKVTQCPFKFPKCVCICFFFFSFISISVALIPWNKAQFYDWVCILSSIILLFRSFISWQIWIYVCNIPEEVEL